MATKKDKDTCFNTVDFFQTVIQESDYFTGKAHVELSIRGTLTSDIAICLVKDFQKYVKYFSKIPVATIYGTLSSRELLKNDLKNLKKHYKRTKAKKIITLKRK